MGRHARGSARSRISPSTVVLGALIIGVVAVGPWLSSRAQPMAIVTAQVDGSAVVVSSLACDAGTGGTLVDVPNRAGGAARAALDGCGFREGEQLAVRYRADDPTRVWIAHQDPADAALTGEGSLPIGLGVAALLGLCAALAVWIDSRRSRRANRRGRGPAAHEIMDADDAADAGPPLMLIEAAELLIEPPADITVEITVTEAGRPLGRHARLDPEAVDPEAVDAGSVAAHAALGPLTAVQVLPLPQAGRSIRTLLPPSSRGGEYADRRMSTVDVVFPYTSSLAASLRDELFTHRGVPT